MNRIPRLVSAMTPLLLVCLAAAFCCCFLIAQDSLSTYFRHQNEERIYREELGIGRSDKEIEDFMTKNLQGLTHQEALEKLSTWGDVDLDEGTCSPSGPSGVCIVYLHGFLGTKRGYEFTILYENSKVDAVRIYYS